MIKKPLLLFIFLLCFFSGISQEINTDELYLEALEEYRNGNYQASLALTSKALAAAPGYHDIRVLQVRNNFALNQFQNTDEDLEILLTEAPTYEGVKTLAMQRLNTMPPEAALSYTDNLLKIYENDSEIKIKKAEILLENKNSSKARAIALEVYASEQITDGQRYALHQLINLTVKNAIQVTGQYIGFSDDYARDDPWYAMSAEFQHNFSRLSLIGRATFSDRSYDQGSFYEIEAYPIISEKFYAFGNIGISNGTIFPDFRASASLYYNFAPSFELETGFRSLFYGENIFLTAIAGLTAYTGKFYLNTRAFIGPRLHDKYLQNYQFNIRYYLTTPENYLFARLGSGISPDNPAHYDIVQENPTLEALYLSGGINKTMGVHHVISAGAGFLSEDLPRENKGTQITATLGYRYKF